MPTQSFYSALLVLGNTEGLPWTASPWQAATKTYGPPWYTPPDSSPDAVSPNAPEWTVKTAQAVKTFADNVWSQDPDEQDDYVVKRQVDNDSAGRTAWKDWVTAGLKTWNLNKAIDEVLIAANRSPYDVMAIHRKRKVSTLFPFYLCY
jgi:hypothetical protein